MQVAIIGAGSAGLAAAQELNRRGIPTTIYEERPDIGGRNTTRQVAGCVIDHGAQNVKSPTAALQQLILSSLEPDGTPAYDIGRPVWIFDAAGNIGDGDPQLNAEPKWGWPSGINRLSQAMAAGIDIRTGVAVQRVVATGNPPVYTLVDPAGNALGEAHALLLTAPAPETSAIIAASTIDQELQEQILHGLAAASYRRCLSIALAYPRRPAVPWYALVNPDRGHAITWLACEHDKPGHAPASLGLMIAQMSHTFSQEHWDAAEPGTYGSDGTPLPPVIAHVDRLVQRLIATDLGAPRWADLYRWPYALPDSSADFAHLNSTGSGLFFAGDYVTAQGRVHLAIESGWDIASQIAHWVAPSASPR